jgi:hypothetical protein
MLLTCRLTVVAAGLPILNALVCATHFIENTEQGIENANTDDGRRPQADKNGNQLMIHTCTENEDINGEEYRQRRSYKVVVRLHTLRI